MDPAEHQSATIHRRARQRPDRPALPRAPQAHTLQESRDRQDAGVPEKPAHAARCHHLRAPQEALAGRVILRMDQVPRIKRSYRTSENACMDGAQDAS